MAIPAQGCVIRWTDWPSGSPVTVQEVTAIDIRPNIERLDFRGEVYYWAGGELTLTGYSNAALPHTKLLRWGTLKITVPSGAGRLVLHEGYAQLIGCNVRATVNQPILFDFQLRLWGRFSTTGTTE